MAAWLALIDPIARLLDKVIPDPEARAAAKLELAKEENQAAFQEIQVSISAILAEAQSIDPWTSRARPTFLYVIYVLMLASLPMAIVHVVSPSTANGLIQGFHGWLSAIPDSYLQLFGIGYLGYTGGRTWEKIKGVAK